MDGAAVAVASGPAGRLAVGQPYQAQFEQFFIEAAASLSGAGVDREFAAQFERLAADVDKPCLLAVVGRMKTGKSTLINALLGDDLAKTGVTETTATINRFVYGTPPSPDRPVRCYWRAGHYTDETPAFLDSLQGHDLETLQRSEAIDFLEYRVPHPNLLQVTLVDTPGTGAVVGQHVQRTADFLAIQQRLCQRHDVQTRRIGSEADAVIYLVGQVPREADAEFLSAFRDATGGAARAFNALGVMSMVERSGALLAQRHHLAAKLAAKMKDSLNTVLPVSAGMQRAIDRWNAAGDGAWERLLQHAHSFPAAVLHKLLKSDELWCEHEFKDSPLDARQRRELAQGMPWTVFTTVMRTAAETEGSASDLRNALVEIAGFDPLKQLLERHFFQRGRILHHYNLLVRAESIVNTIRRVDIPAVRRRQREELQRRDRMLAVLDPLDERDPEVAELRRWIEASIGGASDSSPLENLLWNLGRSLSQWRGELEEYNLDFEALQQIEDIPSIWTEDELNELRRLLGLYGYEVDRRLGGGTTSDWIQQRQRHWRVVGFRDQRPSRAAVARRAEMRYGLILADMLEA